MKIAVCYSGGLRTFKKCYQQNHEVISKLGDVDYYISTWEKPCYTKVARFDDVLAINGTTIYDDLLSPDEKVTYGYLNSLMKFSGKAIHSMETMDRIIEPSRELPWHIMSPARLYCQYFQMAYCFYELVPKDHFDIVIRLRPDVTIEKLPEIDPEKIYINHMTYPGCPAVETDSINEMIYVSNYDNMKKICKIYENIPDLWNKDDAFGEKMSWKNFQKENLLDKCETFDFGLKVVRESGKDEPMS